LGNHTPLLWFLYAYVPGFNLFRGLSKFVIVFSFAGSLLGGYGLAKVAALAEERSRRLRPMACALLALSFLFIGLGIFGLLYGREWWNSFVGAYIREEVHNASLPLTEDSFHAWMTTAFNGFFRSAVIAMLLGGLLIFAQIKKLSKKFLVIAALALAVLDLWSFGSRYLVTFDPGEISMDRELKAFLKGDKEPFRIATPITTLSNVGVLEGIENVGGYDQLTLKSYNEFINFAQGMPIDSPNLAMTVRRFSPLFRLLNVRYYILKPGMSAELPDFDLVFENVGAKVYRDNGAFPRSFIVHQASVRKGGEAILQELISPGFDPTSDSIVEETIDGLPDNPTLPSPAPKVVEHSPRKVLIEADLPDAGLLVLADVYYPGWKAFVDGKESKIHRTDYVMRGVFVPAGRHVVEFRYDPLSFKAGAIISLASLLLIAGFLTWPRSGASNLSKDRATERVLKTRDRRHNLVPRG
jgi:hypothetical protein